MEENGIATGGGELFNGVIVISRLADGLAMEDCNLIRADDECIGELLRERARFLLG